MNTPRYLNETTSSSTSLNIRFFDFGKFQPKPVTFLLLMTSFFLELEFSIFFKSLLSFSSISEFMPDVKIVVSFAESAFLNCLEHFEADYR